MLCEREEVTLLDDEEKKVDVLPAPRETAPVAFAATAPREQSSDATLTRRDMIEKRIVRRHYLSVVSCVVDV